MRLTPRSISRRALCARTAGAGGALLFAACGPRQPAPPAGSQAGPPKRVVFVKTQATELKDNAWRETFKLAEKAIHVIPELVVEPSAGFYEKRTAEFVAGTANADVTINALNQFLPMGLKGMLVDLMPLFRRDKLDAGQYYKADFESWIWKGKLYALTFQAGGEAVMYNKDSFLSRGVKVPTRDWTYDDLLQACQRLNDPAAGFYAIHVQQNTVQYMMGTFMRNFGGKVLNDTRDKALYADDPNSVRGAEFNVDLHQRHRVAWTAALIREHIAPGTTPMRSKRAAMEINGITEAVNIRPEIGAEHLDFAPPPRGPGGIQMARLAGNSWSILALSPNVDAAWTVLKWLHTREGLLSPQLNALAWPPLIWAANSPQWMDQFKGTRIADVTAVWEKAGHNQVVIPEGDQALQLMNQPIARALAGEIATRDALREGAEKVNALFAQRPKEWQL
jgi:ABC-type glycerol-3-phosphate transport system substrate-binding protein